MNTVHFANIVATQIAKALESLQIMERFWYYNENKNVVIYSHV